MKKYQIASLAIGLAVLTLVASCASSSSLDSSIPSSSSEAEPLVVNDKYRTYYQILVYAYADSNDDGIGDFKGIADKLPYLSELGIGGLWLSPVNQATSYHAYDVTDYYAIRSTYVVNGYTFENLIEDAAAYDIDIIMDLVLNHTGRNHMWFVTGGGAYRNNVESKYTTWYNFSKTQDAMHPYGYPEGYYEAIFWDGMPDLNYDNPEVRAEAIKIAKHWLAKGVAGFRLDAAMHIFTDYSIADKWNGDVYDKNIAWWQEFQSALVEDYPDTYLIGEMWTSLEKIKRYYASNLDSAFNFETKRQINNAMNGVDGYSAFLQNFQEGMREYQADGIEAYFFSNHDDGRLTATITNERRLKLAAALQLMAPGNGFVYYGDEIGLKGNGGSGDGLHRTPMRWGDEYVTDPSKYGIGSSYSSSTITYQDVDDQDINEASLLNYYRRLLSIKNAHRELYAGTLTKITTGNSKLQAYTIVFDDIKLVVAHNTDDEAINVATAGIDAYLDGLSPDGIDPSFIDATLTIPAFGTALLSASTTEVTITQITAEPS